MELQKALAANVRRLRESKDLSQEKLAQKAGLTMRFVSGIERGEENPTLKTVSKLAKALGVGGTALFANPKGKAILDR